MTRAKFGINAYHTLQRSIMRKGLEAAVRSWEEFGPEVLRGSERVNENLQPKHLDTDQMLSRQRGASQCKTVVHKLWSYPKGLLKSTDALL